QPPQAEAVTVAQLFQTVAQGKIEGADPVLRPIVDRIEPAVDEFVAGPALSHSEELHLFAAPCVVPVVDRPDDPGAEALDKVVAKTVETDLFDQPLGVVEDAGRDARIDMAEIGHVAEGAGIIFPVRGRVEAGPVAGEDVAFRGKAGPALLVDDRVKLLPVGAVVMVENQVGVDLHLLFVGCLDKPSQLLFRTEPGLHRPFLIVYAQVIIVIDIVPHGHTADVGGLASRREPESGDTGLRQPVEPALHMVPPGKLLPVHCGAVPVKCLHQYAHGFLLDALCHCKAAKVALRSAALSASCPYASSLLMTVLCGFASCMA